MTDQSQNMWAIRAGRSGEADNLFLKSNRVAIGWFKIGGLSQIPADREALKRKIVETYPDRKTGAIPVDAGQLYRFVHEIIPEDIVLYLSKIDRHVHIGKITGPYKYDSSKDPRFPHQRPVKWLKKFPRTQFSPRFQILFSWPA